MLSVDELIEKSKDQWNRKRYEEALVSALAAVKQDNENGEAWWRVALSRQSLGDARNAILALRKTVALIPHGSNAWARLGDLLMKDNELDEAKDAFETALIYDGEQTTALTGLSYIYGKEDDRNQDEEEIAVLEKIQRLSSLSKIQINRLGILHYRNSRHHEAIRSWKTNVWNADHPSQRFNLGLAYSNDLISQYADAIDMWRFVLRDWPDYDPPKKSILSMLPKLLKIANIARRECYSILPRDQWFDHYINPFQLLNLPDESDIEELDAKSIQRLKKKLLQEIDLEEGKVSWIPGFFIDKSRAIGLCEELNDEQKKDWHWQVYCNKPLLNFLTKGSHEHFLVNADRSELDTIDYMECDDSFLEWLGGLFASQYDRVLTKAIDQGDVLLVECLLHGRRWVPDTMIDDCFRNAQRAVERLVKPLDELLKTADKIKPSVIAVEGVLNRGRLLGIMNLLPVFFEKYQNDAVHSIRGLAVKAFNIHEDIDLSRQIIELAKRFKFRSADANRVIEEDVKTIEELIRKEREHEVKINGNNQKWEITKEGVRQGDRFIAASDISSSRWGVLITKQSAVNFWEFLLGFTADNGSALIFQWKVPEHGNEKSRSLFDNMIKATLNYVFPSLVPKIEAILLSGRSINVGPCRVTRHGIHYEVKGWIFTDQHFTPWNRVQVSIDNGDLFIIDAGEPKKRVSFSLKDTDNAHLLRILVNIKNGENN